MKRLFLIDKENTGKRFLKGLDQLTANDKIIIFHYEQAGEIKPEILLPLSKCKAAVEIIKMNTHTKNAMDFQICTYIGFLYSQYKRTAEYYIVSDDKGYGASVEFIKNQIDPKAAITQIGSSMCVETAKDNLVEGLLQGKYQRKVINKIIKGISVSRTKGEFHNYLQQNLNTDFEQIYNLIKPVFTEAKMSLA